MVVRHPAAELVVEPLGGTLADADDRGADLGQGARTKCRCVGGKAGSTKTTFTASRVSWARIPGSQLPCPMVVAAFVAPYLLPATVAVRQHGRGAARRPARGGHQRAGGAGAGPARGGISPGTGGWTTPWTRGRSPRRCAASSRQLGRWSGWSGPSSSCRCRWRRPARPSASRAWTSDRAQRARQVADEGRCCTPPGSRAPATAGAGADRRTAFADEVGFPLVAKPPDGAGAQATYRLDDADMLRSWLAAVPLRRGARAAGGVPRRRGAHLRQRHRRRVDGVVVGRRLPPAAAGGAAQPVDPVDGAAAARHRRPAVRGDPRGRTGGAEALGVRDALTHMEWFGRPDGSVAVSEVGARPPGAQLRRCSATCTTSTSTGVGRAGAPRPVRRARAQVRAGCAYLRGMGTGGCAGPGVHGVEQQRRLGHLVVEARLPEPGQPASSDYRARAT